jgi:uncharacterized membrane protein
MLRVVYYPHEPKEPSGCMQTIIITRMIIGMLAVPIALIMGAVIFIMLAFVALSVHPLLALLVVAIGAGAIILGGRWESRRAAKDFPKDD